MNKITAEIKCTILALSIEKDLRNWIKNELLNSNNLNNLINEKLLNRLKLKVDDEIADDDSLINGADFGESFAILDQHKSKLTSDSKLIFEKINQDLINIKKVRDRRAHKNLLASDIDEMEMFIKKISIHKHIFITLFSELKNLTNKDYDFDFYLDEELEKDEEIENNLPITEHQETGFIRRDKLDRRIDQTLKKNSVVVLTGDAGIGKTSLLLHKCHQYKTQIGNYDEIKWFTFKTQTFSNNEIKELNKSLKSYNKFLQIFSDDKSEDNQINFLLKYLQLKKCLLVLDNLETILDQNIIKFLELTHEVEHNSKIFITSREPIDSGVTIKVSAFDDMSAESLFRKYAQYLDLEFIQRKKSTEIKKLIKLRDNNPLGIKLSLDDVYNGSNIEKAFEPNKDFLNYSYQNLFLKLDQNCKKILEMLYYLEQEFTITTICTYTGIEPIDVEKNLIDLDKKRFLVRDLKDSGTEYYSLRPIIKSFIQKNNLFKDLKSKEKIILIHQRVKTVKSERKINSHAPNKIKYDWDSFLKRKDSDDEAISELTLINRYILSRTRMLSIAMKYQTDAQLDKVLNEIQNKDQETIKKFSFLKKKHPKYCEVYRVEGIFYGHTGSIQDMKNSFETAIKMQPDYPNLRCYFIERLRKNSQFNDSINFGKEYHKMYPDNIEIQYQLIQSMFYLRVFDSLTEELAEKIALKAKEFRDLDFRFSRKLAKTSLEYHRRYAEYLISQGSNDDYHLAYKQIINLSKNFNEFESLSLIDYKTTHSAIKKSFGELKSLSEYFSGTEEDQNIRAIMHVFSNKIEKFMFSSKSDSRQKLIDKFSGEEKFTAAKKALDQKIYKKGDFCTGIFIGDDGRINPKIGGYIKLSDGIFKDYDMSIRDKIFIHSSQGTSYIPNGSKISFKFDDHIGLRRKSLIAINPKVLDN